MAVVAACAMLALAACSGGSKATSSTSDQGQGDSSKPGVSDSSVALAYIGDLSGPDARIEQTYFQGMKLAIDRANANGGVAGRQINLISGDTRFDTTEAINLFKRYTSDEPALAVLGINVSSMFEALTTKISAAKAPVIGPTGVTRVTLDNPYIYNAQTDLTTSAKAITQFVAPQLGSAPRIGVARISTTSGDEWFDLMKKTAPDIHATITGEQKIDPASVEASAQVAQFQADHVDALTLHSSTGIGVALLKSMQASGLNVPVYSTFGANGPALWQSAGALAPKVYAFDAFAPPYSDVQGRSELESAMRTAGAWDQFQADKNYAEGWVIGNVMVQALKRAGKDLTRQSFIDALRSKDGFDAGGYAAPINWSKGNGLADPSSVKTFSYDPTSQRILEVKKP